MPKITGQNKDVYKFNGNAKAPLPGRKKGARLDLKKCPDLVGQIQKDIAALGVVGEADNCLFTYLAGTSRLRKHPLRLIIRGPSSAGKSYPLGKVVSLFPSDQVVEATSLTPQALYYGIDGWLEHKFFVKGERSHRTDEEAAEATAALRQLISEDRIVKQVTVNKETVTIIQNGPIAFCETTTSKSPFVEDLNRCLQVYADPSPEQTKRILGAIARQYDGQPELNQREIIDRHCAFQESLKDVKVIVPFAEQLANHMPAELVSRRAFTQVLATIETIAFLYQFQRERDEQGHLVATLYDYQVAHRLLVNPLQRSIGLGKDHEQYQKLREKLSVPEFDSNQALTALGCSKPSRDRFLKKLSKYGLLELISEGRSHRPARWAWTNKSVDELVLPDVQWIEELACPEPPAPRKKKRARRGVRRTSK